MGAFSLLIVLFWIIVWAFRITKDKKSTKQYDKERDADFASHDIAMSQWLRDVCDDDLEKETEAYVYDVSNSSEIKSIVHSAFKEAGMTMFNYDDKDAIRVILAMQGKLMRSDAMGGILVRPAKLEGESTLDQDNKILNRRKFVLWINSKLKEHGINEDMFINTAMRYYFTVESDEYRCGYFVWRPSIYPSDVKNL